MFKFMKNVWKRELEKTDADNNLEISHENLVNMEQLSMDPGFAMDWIGTPFLLDILSYP